MKMGPVWRQDIKIHDLAFGINTEVSTSINFEIEFRKIVDKSRFNWCGGESTVKLGSEEFLFLSVFRAKTTANGFNSTTGSFVYFDANSAKLKKTLVECIALLIGLSFSVGICLGRSIPPEGAD